MTLSLSILAIVLGLGFAALQVFGLLKPAAFTAVARKFPRSLPWGFALMLLGTAWFLYYLSQESVADFAAYKNLLFVGFAAIGIGSCIFVQDFLAVRGLAVVLLLLAKLMVDTGRPELAATPFVKLFHVWAYLMVCAGIWLTVSPYRLRDWIDWLTASEKRIKAGCGLQLAFGLVIALLGLTKF
jgi:hypothetical protein